MKILRPDCRYNRSLALTAITFLVILVAAPNVSLISFLANGPNLASSNGLDDPDSDPFAGLQEVYSQASEHVEGVMNPAEIEQIGYLSSGDQTAHTDKDSDVGYDFMIDDAHNWLGSGAEVEIWNLTKVFAANGTFDSGITGMNDNLALNVSAYPFGWNTSGYSPNAKTIQRSGYIGEDRKYVVLENEGEQIGTGSNLRFRHGASTIIQFNQSVENTPYTEDFVFEFDYLYLRGPLGLPPTSNISLVARADGVIVWSTNLPDLASRNQWYSSGKIDFSQVGMNESFVFQIALEIPVDVNLYVTDYEFINSVYLTVHVDDVSFNGAAKPGFDEVDLEFAAGAASTPIVGSDGTGEASILNASFWRSPPLSTAITANTTVSFDYRIRLQSHRFSNSTWATDVAREGTLYTASLGESAIQSFYAYLGFLGDYEELTQTFRFPKDWENYTILDPFLADVTSLCSLSAGQIVIPTDIMDHLGWWKVTSESPNYADSIETLRYDSSSLKWSQHSVFRSTNKTMTSLVIGGASPVSEPLLGVNITWLLPNGTTWFYESLDGGSNGVINSSILEFGSLNATAGLWSVRVHWTNGSEVAYDEATFEVHHRANLVPVKTLIEAESGDTVWGYLRHRDAENGEYLLGPSSLVSANWSGSTVHFVSNPAQKWWEANLDTSVLGPGDSLVIANASRQYYDDVSCSFTVRLVFTDNILTMYEKAAEVGLGEIYIAEFKFEDRYGSAIESANVSVAYSGPADGLTQGNVTNLGFGNYSVELTSRYSGTYTVTASASTDHHQVAADTLLLSVGSLTSHLVMLNGSAAIMEYGNTFRLVVRYTNWTGDGLSGADVGVISYTPGTGLDVTSSQYEGDGNYSLVLTPQMAGTFTVLIRANVTNYDTQLSSFTLHVTEIGTTLDTISLVEALYYGRSYSFTFGYRLSSNGTGVQNAQPTATGTGSEWINFIDLGNGLYNITVTPEGIGSYETYITMRKDGYQTRTTTFAFQTTKVPVQVEMLQPVWLQFVPLELSVSLVEEDTGDPVSNAIVEYELVLGTTIYAEGVLTETAPGVYVTTVTGTWNTETSCTIRITMDQEFYELSQAFERDVNLVPNEAGRFLYFLNENGIYIAAVAGSLVVAIVGQRLYARRRREYMTKALAVKKRYDDVDNLIGIVILHKTSGLPVYSNVLKGGFEEGMISAFITAITHFRSEFDTNGEDLTYEVIPISDIIRAVPTQNLVCAFITVSSSSAQQEDRMIDFARGIGVMLDFKMTERPTQVRTAELAAVLESLFDERMDGFLLRYYKRGVAGSFPRRLRYVEDAMVVTEAADCARPGYIAKNMTVDHGISEAEACLLVLEAIEHEFIVLCDKHEVLSFSRMHWRLDAEE